MIPRVALVLVMVGMTVNVPAYVLNLNGSNQARRWELLSSPGYVSTNLVNPVTQAVRYFLAADAYSLTNTAAELDAVRASFAQWQAIAGTHLKFEEGGVIAPVADVNTADDTNIVFWTRTNRFLVDGGLYDMGGSLGVTLVAYYSDNLIASADIVFNGSSAGWFTEFTHASNTNIFLEGVALHEIGHFVGLAHSPAGGATMFWRGGSGITPQAGLSSDEQASARILYPSGLATFGALAGVVTKNGNPVLGAAVYVETPGSNVVAGTVSRADGSYQINGLTAGNYLVRVAPLDPFTTTRLVAGPDISSAFNASDPNFVPTTNVLVTLVAGTTNTADFAVNSTAPAFRITRVRTPTTNPSSYAWSSVPVSLRVGQSNYVVGVGSTSLPTSGATLSITGDGVTVGAATFNPNLDGAGLNLISVSLSVSSNATPGARSFIVRQGTNVACACGFLDVLPAVPDHNFDGLNDYFQRAYFAPWTTAAAAPAVDPDGDGFNNTAEYISGSVPTNSASFLKIQSVTTTANGTTVRWLGSVGKKYQVASRTNFTTAAWQNIGGVQTTTT